MSIISVPVAVHSRENECTLCGWEWETQEGEIPFHCPQCDGDPGWQPTEDQKHKTPST